MPFCHGLEWQEPSGWEPFPAEQSGACFLGLRYAGWWLWRPEHAYRIITAAKLSANGKHLQVVATDDLGEFGAMLRKLNAVTAAEVAWPMPGPVSENPSMLVRACAGACVRMRVWLYDM